jgi:hypothetical protein
MRAGAENLVPTGVPTPNRPSRSKSLHKLRNPVGLFITDMVYVLYTLAFANNKLLVLTIKQKYSTKFFLSFVVWISKHFIQSQ